jgi:hypothetical protein
MGRAGTSNRWRERGRLAPENDFQYVFQDSGKRGMQGLLRERQG